MTTKRENIINETITRLENQFDSTHIVKRGKVNIQETDIPCVYLYEDVEEVQKKQWDNYICNLPLQIDIYDRAYTNPYVIGNDYISKTRIALEIDRYYNNLVLDYGVVLRFIDITLDPLVKTTIVYEFVYNELFGK